MKAEMIKRFFKAIASDEKKAITQLMTFFIDQERQNGHTQLAEQLENIMKKSSTNTKVSPESRFSLTQLPTSVRSELPLVTLVEREKLRHHMILPETTEKRFQRIEQEYLARDRLAHYGLPYRQKILLYGFPGCGKTIGAERLAWNIGLPLLKVRLDAMVSSFLGETAINLRRIFEEASKTPCLLFLDECDSIAKSREDSQDVGEMKRVVNTLLQILDEHESSSGLIVAATNLTKSLDIALWRRFDDAIEVPKPGAKELEFILRSIVANTIQLKITDLGAFISEMEGFSTAQAIQVVQDAVKSMILENIAYENMDTLLLQKYLNVIIWEYKNN
jgi:SpoVK/Ycf46/Vps4 family AAA+-type ATPase